MITLDLDSTLTLDELTSVARRGDAVSLSAGARAEVAASHALLQQAIAEGRRIYGVTTGFGPLADHYVHPDRTEDLQRGLVYHLATGVGDPLAVDATRAMMLARASSIARGKSAVSPETLDLLIDALNAGLVPIVPSLGTVGASGDLTPLAHVALALMGEAPFWDAATLESAGLEPLSLTNREALGLVNGTSAMTGIAALNGHDAGRAFDVALRLAFANAEVFQASSAPFHRLVGQVRPHPGQFETIERIDELSQTSTRLRSDRHTLDLAQLEDGPLPDQELAQDPYTIRCIPQLFGAMHDQIRTHNEWTERELNSVTDNPIFDAPSGEIVHCGNFQGQHLAFASDALNNALIQLAVHAERVVARLTDRRRNAGLPPFLQGSRAGLQSGFMGAQVTATSLVAELRTHATPASVQSISTNADNQDVVSMGTIAALRTSRSVDRVFELLAIESMVVAQAVDLVGDRGFSSSTRELVATVREMSPFLERDRPLSQEIRALASHLRQM